MGSSEEGLAEKCCFSTGTLPHGSAWKLPWYYVLDLTTFLLPSLLSVWSRPPSSLGFPGGSDGKASTCTAGDLGSIPGLGKSLGEGNYSNILAWRVPWREEPGRLQSMGSQRVGHDWAREQEQARGWTGIPKLSFLSGSWEPSSVQGYQPKWIHIYPGSRCTLRAEFLQTHIPCVKDKSKFKTKLIKTVYLETYCKGTPAVIFASTGVQKCQGYNLLRKNEICCLVAQSCPTLCHPTDCSTPGFPIPHHLPEFAQTHVQSQWCHPTISRLCCPLLFLPSIFLSIRVFSNESALSIRWPEYWSFSFSISPSNEYSQLMSFRIDWFDLLAVQGTLSTSWKASVLWWSVFFMVQLSHPYTTTGKTTADLCLIFILTQRSLYWSLSVKTSFNMLSRCILM